MPIDLTRTEFFGIPKGYGDSFRFNGFMGKTVYSVNSTVIDQLAAGCLYDSYRVNASDEATYTKYTYMKNMSTVLYQ